MEEKKKVKLSMSGNYLILKIHEDLLDISKKLLSKKTFKLDERIKELGDSIKKLENKK